MWLLLAAACQWTTVKVADTGDSGGDSAADTGADTGGEGPVDPEIVSVERVECAGDETYGETWYVDFTIDDPQGVDTVYEGAITVLDADASPIVTYGIACRDGACSGYFRAEFDGITCAMGPELTFVLSVVDEDGHWSEPWYRNP